MVFGAIFGTDTRSSLPYIISGIVCWSITGGMLADSTSVFFGASGLMQAQKMPLSFHVMLQVDKLYINFVHQLVALWVVLLIVRLLPIPHWEILFSLPLAAATASLFPSLPEMMHGPVRAEQAMAAFDGAAGMRMLLVWAAGALLLLGLMLASELRFRRLASRGLAGPAVMGYIPIGMISIRYRDVNYMIGFIAQAMFMLTPVFWRRSQMPPKMQWIVTFNPFAHLLEIVRQPLLGHPALASDWIASVIFLLLCTIATVVSLTLFRRRVIFWL